MHTLGKIRQALLDDLSRIESDTQFTTTYLNARINESIQFMANLHDWQETQGSLKHGIKTGRDYVFYPENLRTDSVKIIKILDEEYDLVLFREFERHRDNNPNSTLKIATDYERKLFVHPTPTVTHPTGAKIWGNIVPPDTTNDNKLHVFAYQSVLEQAIFKYAQGSCLMKERGSYLSKGEKMQENAIAAANAEWKKQREKQAEYKTQDTVMFDHLNLIDEGQNGVAPFSEGNFNNC